MRSAANTLREAISIRKDELRQKRRPVSAARIAKIISLEYEAQCELLWFMAISVLGRDSDKIQGNPDLL